MPLNRVTITGADDATQIADLYAVWQDFPFVEWGILIGSHEAQPRFPTRAWINSLVTLRAATGNRMHLSLHVCGRHLRDIAAGRSDLGNWLGAMLYGFERVQLNWHGQWQEADCAENVLGAFCKLDSGFGWDPTLIFQLDGPNDQLYQSAARRFACCGLFDRSHGAGVTPTDWPQCSTEMACGWAGGLGPDNLAAELPRIAAKTWKAIDWWVDMESKVRSHVDGESVLDLGSVRQCLEIAAPHVGAAAVA